MIFVISYLNDPIELPGEFGLQFFCFNPFNGSYLNWLQHRIPEIFW